MTDFATKLEICRDDEGTVQLTVTLPENFRQHQVERQTSASLPRTRLTDGEYENPDGCPVVIDTDLLDQAFQQICGPLQHLQGGENHVTIWK